jgi:hypothetical protein
MRRRFVGSPRSNVGFDYAKACLDLRARLTYGEIASGIGYASPAAINDILRGVIPAHPQGEALYALYLAVFERKPPMTPEQIAGGPIKFDLRSGRCKAGGPSV